MTKYEFVEEHDLLLNEYWYFTREDGLCMTGSMSKSREQAYAFFTKVTSSRPQSKEEVIDTIYMITK